eukprot:COSAG01_NODE_433_length_17113_cov_23.009757_14_plen_57_part_00
MIVSVVKIDWELRTRTHFEVTRKFPTDTYGVEQVAEDLPRDQYVIVWGTSVGVVMV